MKFRLTNVMRDDLGIVEINTLEELLKLQQEKADPLIIDTTSKWERDRGEPDWEIEIYNGYRE